VAARAGENLYLRLWLAKWRNVWLQWRLPAIGGGVAAGGAAWLA